MARLRRVALCLECGKPMRYDNHMKAWDCGPEKEGGHGFWDDSNSFEWRYVVTSERKNEVVTLYYVGDSELNAQTNSWVFDTYESANSYRMDTDPANNVYSVSAAVLWETIELVN